MLETEKFTTKNRSIHDSIFVIIRTPSPIVRSNVCAASTTRVTVRWPRLPGNRPIHPCRCVPRTAAWRWLRRTEERRRSPDTVPWRTRKSWAVVWPASWCAAPLTTCTARLWRIPITSWPTTRRSADFRKSYKGKDQGRTRGQSNYRPPPSAKKIESRERYAKKIVCFLSLRSYIFLQRSYNFTTARLLRLFLLTKQFLLPQGFFFYIHFLGLSPKFIREEYFELSGRSVCGDESMKICVKIKRENLKLYVMGRSGEERLIVVLRCDTISITEPLDLSKRFEEIWKHGLTTIFRNYTSV